MSSCESEFNAAEFDGAEGMHLMRRELMLRSVNPPESEREMIPCKLLVMDYETVIRLLQQDWIQQPDNAHPHVVSLE